MVERQTDNLKVGGSIPPTPTMSLKTGIKISLFGTGVEAIGMFLDVIHHLNIGLETPEGLLSPFHFIIFVGFLINFIGVLITKLSKKS